MKLQVDLIDTEDLVLYHYNVRSIFVNENEKVGQDRRQTRNKEEIIFYIFANA